MTQNNVLVVLTAANEVLSTNRLYGMWCGVSATKLVECMKSCFITDNYTTSGKTFKLKAHKLQSAECKVLYLNNRSLNFSFKLDSYGLFNKHQNRQTLRMGYTKVSVLSRKSSKLTNKKH